MAIFFGATAHAQAICITSKTHLLEVRLALDTHKLYLRFIHGLEEAGPCKHPGLSIVASDVLYVRRFMLRIDQDFCFKAIFFN